MKQEWLGKWESFENYIYSEEPEMKNVWQQAEEACAGKGMFAHGVKAFWQKACTTVTDENPDSISVVEISEEKGEMYISWHSKNSFLGKERYVLKETVRHGFEGKAAYVFLAEEADEKWPFRCFVSMAPMARNDLLSHLHFQFAAKEELLINNDSLINQYWYATLCELSDDIEKKCDVVKAMHHLSH